MRDASGFKKTRRDATNVEDNDEGGDDEEDDESSQGTLKCRKPEEATKKDEEFSFSKLFSSVRNSVYGPINEYICGTKCDQARDHRTSTKHQKRRRDRRATPKCSSDGIYRRDSKKSCATFVGGHETPRRRRRTGHACDESRCGDSVRSASISPTLKLNCNHCRTLNWHCGDRLSIWRVAAEELYVGGKLVADRKSSSRTKTSLRKVAGVERLLDKNNRSAQPVNELPTAVIYRMTVDSATTSEETTRRCASAIPDEKCLQVWSWRKAASELYGMAHCSENDTEAKKKETETTAGATDNGNDVNDNTSSNKDKNNSDNNPALDNGRIVPRTERYVDGTPSKGSVDKETKGQVELKHTSFSKIVSPDKSKSCTQLNKSNSSRPHRRDGYRVSAKAVTPNIRENSKVSKTSDSISCAGKQKRNINRNKLELKSSSDQQVLQFYKNYERHINKRIMNGKDGYRLKLHNMFLLDKTADGCGNFYYRTGGGGGRVSRKKDDLMSKSENEISTLVNRYNDNILKDYPLIIRANNFVDGGRIKMDEEMRTRERREVKNRTELYDVESEWFKLGGEQCVYDADDKAILKEFSRQRTNPNERYKVSLTCSPAFLKSYKRKDKDGETAKDGGQLYPNKGIPVFAKDDSTTSSVKHPSDASPKEDKRKKKSCEKKRKESKQKKNSKQSITEEPQCVTVQPEETEQDPYCSDQTSTTYEPSPSASTDCVPESSSGRISQRSSSSKQQKLCSRCKLSLTTCSCLKTRDRSNAIKPHPTDQQEPPPPADPAPDKKKKMCYHAKDVVCTCCNDGQEQMSGSESVRISIGKNDTYSDSAKRIFCCCCQPDCSLKDSLKRMFCISFPSSTSSETRCFKKKDYSKTCTFFFNKNNK